MRIAIDFDGTIVSQEHAYDDLETPLQFLPGAKEGLLALKRAGHTLLLWSARSAPRLLVDPNLDPLVRAGAVHKSEDEYRANQGLYQARYRQMVDFVDTQLAGVFDAVDDGMGGKPGCDLFVDDRAMQASGSGFWRDLASSHGDTVPAPEPREGMPYMDVVACVQDLCAGRATLTTIGQTSVGPILCVHVAAPEGAPVAVVICAQHGEEQAGTVAFCRHGERVMRRAAELGVELLVFPCANPEGFDAIERYNLKEEQPVNAFMEYNVDGAWVGELAPDEEAWATRRYPRDKMAHETRCLAAALEGLAKIDAMVDVHGDSSVPRGGAFAYVFGPRGKYRAAMRASEAEPLANFVLNNDSWTSRHVDTVTDAWGLLELKDGSVTDWANTIGASFSACLETSVKDGDEAAVSIAVSWMLSCVENAAKVGR